MNELLLRYLRRQTTDAEARRVEAWARGSPENERVLAGLQRVVAAARVVDGAVEPPPPPRVEDVVWRAEARRAQWAAGRDSGARRWGGPARYRLRLFGGLTVAAAALIAGLALWNSAARPGSEGSGALAAQEFVTGTDETALVRLDDGSVIRLGPSSRLATAARESVREVTLRGEAFFAIARNEAVPFEVVTAAGTARVLGTRFHLSAGVDEISVIVVEGRVALAGEDQEVQVGAGQATSLRRGRTGPVTDAPALDQVADWMTDFLVFQDTPLAVAMQEVADRFGVEVEIAEPALNERTLTMWFDSKSLEEVMTVVCSVIDVECGIGQGTVTIGAGDAGAGS